jgi:NADPH:quinone reductase-like Zn-dependent oxidoreductase
MMPRFETVWVFTACAFALAAAPLHVAAKPVAIPSTTRHVVYDRVENGYRLKVIQVPVPKPGPGQVLLHVRAVSLNRGEIENMAQAEGRDRSGMIAASDGAGEVVALGPEARQFKVGQRVTSMYFHDWNDGPPAGEHVRGAVGSSMDGVFGDYVVIDESALVAIPEGWSDADAATLPTAGLAAYSAVITEGRAAPGKIVLVQGTGGVSTFALQLAHAAGATVIVTSGSDDKLARARALGASQTINYRTTPEWGAKVLELTGGHGADVIVEVGGKGTLAQSEKCLAEAGTLAIIGGITGYGGQFSALTLLDKGARAVGVVVGPRVRLKEMQDFMTRHRVRPVVDRVYELDELESALGQLRSGQFVGKLVVRLSTAHQ